MNILPQPEPAVNAVIVDSNMTAFDARQCINEIKGHLNSVRLLLLELDERRGWEALGYFSMRHCMVGEFGRSQSQLYRELKAGKIEREISPMGEIGLIPERQLRYIGQIPPERWSSAWSEVIATAPLKGVTTSHVAKTVARIKSELIPAQKLKPADNRNVTNADQDFVLGEWVEVRTRNGNAAWDRLLGPVTRVEQHEITVQLDDVLWKHLRFYRDELVKVPPPNEDLNHMIESSIASAPPKSFYSKGDIVVIDCPASAGQEYRRWNGYWGLITNIGRSGSVEVVVAGLKVRFVKSDFDSIDNPAPVLKEVAHKVNLLFNSPDLDELDKQILEFYVKRLSFTEKQLDRLSYIWSQYFNKDIVRLDE